MAAWQDAMPQPGEVICWLKTVPEQDFAANSPLPKILSAERYNFKLSGKVKEISSYKVLSRVSHSLRSLLWSAYQTDSEIRSIINNAEAITFLPPSDASKNTNHRLSIWLYHVTENEYASRPELRGQQGQPPLALTLYYLITPFASTNDGNDANLLLFGKTLQAIRDISVILLEEADSDVYEEISVTFDPREEGELFRIWEALREPYRLSICCRLSIVRIDSTHPLTPIVQ